MGASLNFDARNVAPTSRFDPLPNGTYRMHITESEVKPTKNGAGQYLQLVWEVLDGEFKGRKVWDRLNIQNSNQTAQDIAQLALSAICHACGTLTLSNSAQLHHKPVMVTLVVKQDSGYEPRNEVKKYAACEGMGIAQPKAGATAQGGEAAGSIASSSTAAPATVVPGWAKKSA